MFCAWPLGVGALSTPPWAPVPSQSLTHTAGTPPHPTSHREDRLSNVVKMAKLGVGEGGEYIIVMTREIKPIKPKYYLKYENIKGK